MASETEDNLTGAASEQVLADEILAEAERKAQRAAERGEREAKQVLADARREADEAAAQTLQEAQERAERQAGSILATVQAEARRDLLEAREAELQRLFDAARERLADRDSYDYPAVLARLAVQAIKAMGADEVVIELSEQDRGIATGEWLDEVRRRVDRDVTLDVASAQSPIDGGLIVRSADERLLYDNSFAARLRRLRPELRRELADMLFGNEGEETRDASGITHPDRRCC